MFKFYKEKTFKTGLLLKSFLLMYTRSYSRITKTESKALLRDTQ